MVIEMRGGFGTANPPRRFRNVLASGSARGVGRYFFFGFASAVLASFGLKVPLRKGSP